MDLQIHNITKCMTAFLRIATRYMYMYTALGTMLYVSVQQHVLLRIQLHSIVGQPHSLGR